MRKTSQDGGDTTSITSGVENETKKPGGLIKTKKNSIKRKVQGLSHESDDTVIEPLLQKDMDKTDTSNQSAKYDLLSKTKTEAIIEIDNDKQKLLQDGYADTFISMPSTSKLPKSTNGTAPLHNHMNANVFSSHDALKGLITTKSQVLVEIDGNKQSGYNPSPLIFTTAKIHTDGKNRHMEPLQVTPVPILSTIEVSVLKGKNVNNSGKSSGLVTSNISPMYENISKSNANIQDKGQQIKCTSPGVTTTQSNKIVDSKPSNTTVKQFNSAIMSTKDKAALNAESVAIKEFNVGSKFAVSNLNDNMPTENKPGSIEMNRNSKQSKLSISQPVTGTSLIDAKTIVSKPANKVSPQTSSTNQADKNNVRNESQQSNQNKKSENLNTLLRKTDLNKNITHIDSQNSTVKDKSVVNTVPTSSKQLQRQKIAIDKDDTTTKSKLDDGASVSKNIIQLKSTGKDIIQLSDKSKFPDSTANNIQMTIGTAVTKPLESNIITTTTNKSITSNPEISAKPIMKSHNSTLPQSKISVSTVDATISSTLPATSIVKSLSSNVTTETDSRNADSLSSNTHTSRGVSNKPSTSGMLVSSKTTPSPMYQPVDVKTTAKELTTTTKSVPQTIVTKPIDFNTKVSTTSTCIAKNPASFINIAKSPTSTIKTEHGCVTTDAAKSLPISICSTKNPSVSTNITTKSLPVSGSIGKKALVTTSTTNTSRSITSVSKISPVLTTTIAKSPSTTISVNKPSVTTSIGKASPAITGKTPFTTTSSSKILPVTTGIMVSQFASTAENSCATITANNAKTPSIISSFTKIPLLATSTVPSSSTTTNTAKSQAIATCTEYTPSVSSTSKELAATASIVQSLPATTVSAKNAPVTTSHEKTPPVKKSFPATTTSVKIPPVITSTVTSPLAASSTAKSIPISTNTVKSPSVATMTAKSPVVSTNIICSATNSIKTPSVIASSSNSPTTKSTTSTSKTDVTSPALSSSKSQVHAVNTTAPSSSSTSNSLVSQKKPEAKSTELSSSNKNLKA